MGIIECLTIGETFKINEKLNDQLMCSPDDIEEEPCLIDHCSPHNTVVE